MDTHSYIVRAVQESVAYQKGRRMGVQKLLPKTVCALKFLIACASIGRSVSYEDVSIHCAMGNAQWANITFGPILRIIRSVDKDRKFPHRDIPDITSIVSKKGTATPGEGFFINHEDVAEKGLAQKNNFVLHERNRALTWQHWNELSAFLGLTCLPVLAPSRSALLTFSENSVAPHGKSAEHQNMQNRILAEPQSTGISLQGELIADSGETEYLFWSLDRLDVIVKTTEEWIGFEVKPKNSSVLELRKGIYQVVKYRALIEADLIDQGLVKVCRCLLVLGGNLPTELLRLSRTLNLQVVENYSPI